MKAGAKMAMHYTYTAKSSADDFASAINTQVKAKSTAISFTAPRSAKVGERVPIFAMTPEGAPLSGAKVTITYPDGTIQQVKTDSKGSASFVAAKEGFYTYSIEGYSMTKLSSTETAPAEIPAAAAAAVASDGLFSSISGILPALAAIFVIAVVALIAYNFFTSRKEEEEYVAAPPQQPAGSNPSAQRPVPEPPQAPHAYSNSGAQGVATYSQQYTFGSQKKADAPKPAPVASQPQSAEGKTYGSREQSPAMRPVIVPPHMLNRQAEKYSESTSSDEDVENELASLERKAREEGEGATHEQEIENAISELEAIRQKLRERKEQMDSLESRLSGSKKKESEEEAEADSDEPDEPTASRKAPARRAAPAPRVLPPKGKKLKFATHGIRRK
jgi:hypothetical protein